MSAKAHVAVLGMFSQACGCLGSSLLFTRGDVWWIDPMTCPMSLESFHEHWYMCVVCSC